MEKFKNLIPFLLGTKKYCKLIKIEYTINSGFKPKGLKFRSSSKITNESYHELIFIDENFNKNIKYFEKINPEISELEIISLGECLKIDNNITYDWNIFNLKLSEDILSRLDNDLYRITIRNNYFKKRIVYDNKKSKNKKSEYKINIPNSEGNSTPFFNELL